MLSFASNAEFQMPFIRFIRWFAGATTVASPLNDPQMIDPTVINRFRVSVSPATAGNFPATLVDIDSGVPVPTVVPPAVGWIGLAVPVGTSNSIKEVAIPAGTLGASRNFMLRVSGVVGGAPNAATEVELNT